jgi:hypothetical protein
VAGTSAAVQIKLALGFAIRLADRASSVASDALVASAASMQRMHQVHWVSAAIATMSRRVKMTLLAAWQNGRTGRINSLLLRHAQHRHAFIAQ